MAETEKSRATALARKSSDLVRGVDFDRYQRPELIESIESILSVSETVLRFFRVMIVTAVLSILLMTLAFYGEHWLTIGLVFLYSLVGSFFIGGALGVTLCGKHILEHMVRVLDTSFDITGQVLDDVGNIRERGLAISAVAVLGGVNNGVVLPALEGVVRARTGFLSRPVLWVYRRTFKKLARLVEAGLMRTARAIDGDQQPDGALATVESGANRVAEIIDRLRHAAVGIASTVTGAIMLPLWLLFTSALLFVTTPLGLTWYFTH